MKKWNTNYISFFICLIVLTIINFIQVDYSNAGMIKSHQIIYKTDTLFYSNHSILCVTRKLDKKKDGKQEWYYDNSKLWKYYTFKDDSLNGPYKEYYKNEGTEKEVGFYKSNIPFGHWFEYYPNSIKKAEGEYYDKEMINISKPNSDIMLLFVLDSHHNIKSSQPLTHLLMDSLKLEFDLSKESAIPFPLQRNVKDGIWDYYNDHEKLIRRETYKRGELLTSKIY